MTTKKQKRMLTEEYMGELMRRIDNKMQAYELYRRPQDKMMLECMLQDYEAKQKLMMQDEKLKEIPSPFSPR